MALLNKKKKADLQWCPVHYVSGVAGSEHICKRIAQCIICRKTISLMISQSENPEVGTTVRRQCYGGNCHFDKNLIHIIQDFNDLLNLDYG